MRTDGGEMLPLENVVRMQRDDGAAGHQPLQPVPVGGDQRVGRARVQLGPGAAGDGAARAARRCRRAWASRGRACRSRRARPGGSRSSSSASALLLVYLTLAAQYESLVLPFIVLLGVPLAVLGALGAQWLRGLANDVYCQIGLVMLVGLAAKNSILIVEFAEQLRHGARASSRRRSRRRGSGCGRS